jgi:2-C-methyl-D-erythritol 2,4-cyclodiphosphate synthase
MSTGLRIGQGFDVHRFSEDPHRPLVLGGVTIEGARGLDGHSDADAVCHALADAVLGAVGLGDLGRHFPDTDPAWAGADSAGLLARVVALAAEEGYAAVNADCTIVAETPRLAPHAEAMTSRLCAVLGAPVSVKATRAEGLGALGRAEGIACLAVVLMGPAPA